MNRLFTTMKSNVGNNIQDTSSAMATIIGRYINDAYRDLLRRINWNLVDEDYSFTTTSGTQDYVLPDNFGKELYVHDATNLREYDWVDLKTLVAENPTSLSLSDVPERYTILNKMVQNQPSSASVLSIVSSSAADTTQTCHVIGISSSITLSEDVTLTGTTPAATSNSYTEILSISFSAVRTGKVTITSNSGGVTNAVVAPSVLDYRVKAIRLQKIPAGSYTINMPYEIKPLPLSDDNDILLIDAADVIEDMATAKAWRYKRQMAKAQEWERISEKNIVQLVWDKENAPNRIQRMQIAPYSRDIY